MESLLNGKFIVTLNNSNASLTGGWSGARQTRVYTVKCNETNKHCYVTVYGGSMATIDEKDALYYLLSDAVNYINARHYESISEYLVEEFGYDEYAEDVYGRLRKNPELTRLEKGLTNQYKKAFNIIGDDNKIIDLLDEFREEYDY